ncbi:MAG: hypothetical protein Q8P42_13370, partial [Gallionella sp.]|nr:hypothetical protein [Gallionella sp.]
SLNVQLLDKPKATLVSSSDSPNFRGISNACAMRSSLIVFALAACVTALLKTHAHLPALP